jgi:FKBP-type peptidyl-prolyl cis-trans isomerase SlpA
MRGEDMNQTVNAGSLVTLHYSISTEAGQVLVSTFEATPATLQLGRGELMPAMERCLVGVASGERNVFVLTPNQAFGAYNDQLIQRVPRALLPQDGSAEEMALIEFTAPDGSKFVGLLKEWQGDEAVMDFNHPLAGKTIRFEVEVVGVN